MKFYLPPAGGPAVANLLALAFKVIAMKEKLILLHGALGAKSNLYPLAEQLAEDFELRLLDFRGHGTKAGQGPMTMDSFCAELELALRQSAPVQTHVFGYSMGGYVGLKMALNAPLHWGKLICLGTVFDWDPARGQKEASRLDPDQIAAKHPRFADYLATLHGREHWAGLVTQTAELLRSLGQAPALSAADLTQIKLPTLVLRGEEDHKLALAEAQNLADKLPQGTFQSIPQGLHPIEKQDFSQLAQRIKAFLKNND